MLDHMRGLTERLGTFFSSHTAEVPHLDELCERAILSREGFDGQVQLQQLQLLVVTIHFHFNLSGERHMLGVAAASRSMAGARVLH